MQYILRSFFTLSFSIVFLLLLPQLTEIHASKSVSNDEFGFTVEIPDNWTSEEPLIAKSKFIHRDDDGYEMVTIAVEDFDGSVSFSDYSTDELSELLLGMISTIAGPSTTSLIDYGRTDISGTDAIWLETESNVVLATKEIHYSFVKSQHIYVITGTVLPAADYSIHKAQLVKIITSFKFIEPDRVNTNITSDNLNLPTNSPSATDIKPVNISGGDPFPVALAKGFGASFLKVLAGSVIIGIISALIKSSKKNKTKTQKS